MIRYTSSPPRREGVILVVVVSLLALFAVIGLGYVIYAESAATASRYSREAQVASGFTAEISPELVLNAALTRLIYDSYDDQTGVYNALRGHSLARSMYGLSYPIIADVAPGTIIQTTYGANPIQVPSVPATLQPFIQSGQVVVINNNVVPFNGTGRIVYNEGVNATGSLFPVNGQNLSGLPWNQIINYTLFNGVTGNLNYRSHDSIVRDPERYPQDPTVANPALNNQTNYRENYGLLNASGFPATSKQVYFGGYNQPYTYPDLNNVFLGAVRASDGQVLVPSFHRPWLFPDVTSAAVPPPPDYNFLVNTAHPDWYRPSGRLKMLRPRPVDSLTQGQLQTAIGTPTVPENIAAPKIAQLATFINNLQKAGKLIQYPTDPGGDVKNLLGSPGGADSVWIDPGFPVRSTRDGRKYKPLVAFLVVDMDGRVNINAAGNMKGAINPSSNASLQVIQVSPGRYTHVGHVSSQALGRHEINVQKVLNPNALQQIALEYPNLFTGIAVSGLKGRYAMSGGAWTGSTLPFPSMLNPPMTPDPSSVPTDLNVSAFAPVYFPVDVDAGRQDAIGTFRSIPARGFDFDFSTPLTMPLILSSFPDAYTSPPQNSMPLTGNVPAYTSTVFGANSIANTGYGNDSAQERLGHPMLYNTVRKTGYSQLLDAQEMHRLHARYNSPLDWQDSVLSKLLPLALQNPAVRHSITLLSADVARPGLAPQAHILTYTGTLMPPPTTNLTVDNTLTAPLSQIALSPRGESLPYPFAPVYPKPLPFGQFPLLGAGPTSLPNDFMGDRAAYFRPPPVVPATPDTTTGYKQDTVSAGAARYSNDGRNYASNLRERIDLNRPLRPYPVLTPGSTIPVTLPNPGNVNVFPYMNPASTAEIQTADQDRVQFAQDVFDALRKSTSGPEITARLAAGSPDFTTLQNLAQLAVNIVDDIDEDDVSTVWRWINSPTIPPTNSYVFGVEQPKVVINEVYIEQTNGDGSGTFVTTMGPPAARRAIKYRMNVWVELHNTMVPPFHADTNPTQYSAHRDYHTQSMLRGPGGAISAYQLHLVSGTPTTPIPTVGPPPLSDSPHWPNGTAPTSPVDARTFSFLGQPADKAVIFPVNTSTNAAIGAPSSYKSRDIDTVKNEGFFVLGPELFDLASLPAPYSTAAHDLKPPGASNPLATITSPMLHFEVQANMADTTPAHLAPKIVLQRLANPYIAENPIPGAGYNPYVTVDVVDYTLPTSSPPAHVFDSANFKPVGRGIVKTSTGPAGPGGGTPRSVARRQPFAGNITRLVNQYLDPAAGPSPPEHSFFRHNGSKPTPPTTPLPDGIMERFDWLVHHDRKLTSPMELIHVPAVAPWELTQKFTYYTPITENDAGGPTPHHYVVRQGHTAPWLDELNAIDMSMATTPIEKKKSLQDIQVPPPNPPAPAPAGQPLPAPASTRLYRALEMFRTGDRTVEMAFGGRDIGKININTIYDQATFNAVCDAVIKQHTNGTPLFDSSLGFTQADVNSAWGTMTDGQLNRSARTPRLSNVGTYVQITDRDLPFWSMGAPHSAVSTMSRQEWVPTGYTSPLPEYVLNSGIEATVLRSIVPPPTGPVFSRPRMFDSESQFAVAVPPTPPTPQVPGDANTINPLPPVRHPLLEKSLLTKIFEHLTTRSNVFEVYMTVGYFEVRDDTQKPELLGDEIGMLRDASGVVVENKAIRHRMFAIIDRTNLTLQPPMFSMVTGKMEVIDPQKREDSQRQGPPPYFYTSQLQATPPVNTTTNAITRWKVIMPVTAPSGPVGYIDSASGNYNGITWQLNAALKPNSTQSAAIQPAVVINGVKQSASVLFVGTGSDQRRMVVCAIRSLGTGFVEVEVGIPPFEPLTSLNPTNAHILSKWLNLGSPPTAPALITNAVAGNPGPQPDFDHKQPNYRGVVLYSVIMD